MQDENDENDDFRYTGEVGVIVSVTKKVPQEELPVEDRIPAELEGVPIQIVEEPYPEFLKSTAPAWEEPNSNAEED